MYQGNITVVKKCLLACFEVFVFTSSKSIDHIFLLILHVCFALSPLSQPAYYLHCSPGTVCTDICKCHMIFHVWEVGQVRISIFYLRFSSAEKYNYAEMFPVTKLPTFCKLETIYSCNIYRLQVHTQAYLST